MTVDLASLLILLFLCLPGAIIAVSAFSPPIQRRGMVGRTYALGMSILLAGAGILYLL